MTKRKLEDLNLLDDFLFNSVVNYPASDTDKHGARLDVYMEETCTGNSENDIKVYNIEPDKNINDANILPKRVRFYHAKIDAHCLKSGESYQMLKKGNGHFDYSI